MVKLKETNTIIFYKRDEIIPVCILDIVLFQINLGRIVAYNGIGEKLYLNERLHILESRLFPHFFRANRQFLINKNAVKSAKALTGRKLLVELDSAISDVKVVIPKERKRIFLQWLKGE